MRGNVLLVLLCALLLVVPVQATLLSRTGETIADPVTAIDPDASTARPSAGPVTFEPNVGQTDNEVRYIARGAGAPLYLTDNGAVMTITSAEGRTAVALTFLGANPAPTFTGLDPTGHTSSYLIGNDQNDWHRDVPHHARVLVEDLYPGIDVLYYAAPGGGVEYDLIVAPGADPAQVRIAFDGATDVHVLADGALRIDGRTSGFTMHAPVSFQDTPVGRLPVDSMFDVSDDGTIGFTLGTYDATRPLVIDPILAFSTYLAGGADEQVGPMHVDTLGFLYVSGVTESLDFPDSLIGQLTGTDDGDPVGRDVFITVIDPTGTAVLKTTYIGGGGTESIRALEPAGVVPTLLDGVPLTTPLFYIAGSTGSRDFPTTAAALQPEPDQFTEMYVALVDLASDTFVASTYFGGFRHDWLTDLTITPTGEVVIAVASHYGGQPTTPDAYDPTFNGGFFDAYVGKLDAALTTLQFGTYFGGSHNERATSVDVGPLGEIYVAGVAYTDQTPSKNGLQPHAGMWDDFVIELTPDGSELVWATRLGGSDREGMGEDARDPNVHVDIRGDLIVCGRTGSADFPGTAGGMQSSFGGVRDLFVSRIDPDGPTLLGSTFLGGSSNEAGECRYDAARDQILFIGATNSPDMPLVDSLQPLASVRSDLYVAQLTGDASELLFATLHGGIWDDNRGVAYFPLTYSGTQSDVVMDALGNIVYGGVTSTRIPTTLNAVRCDDPGNAGLDAFVAKVLLVPIELPPEVADVWNQCDMPL